MLGISKRALLEDYYPDELEEIFAAWSELHGHEREEEREVDVLEFLAL